MDILKASESHAAAAYHAVWPGMALNVNPSVPLIIDPLDIVGKKTKNTHTSTSTRTHVRGSCNSTTSLPKDTSHPIRTHLKDCALRVPAAHVTMPLITTSDQINPRP